jgi:hypothetical protein
MKIFFGLFFIFICKVPVAQELYVYTEPASNMAAGSLGFRLNSKIFKMNHNAKFSYRVEPEIMVGVNKKLMVHLAAYGSDMFQNKFRFEGGSLYGKYRLLSQDEVHKHFRLAAYAKVSAIDNPQVLLTTKKYSLPDGNGGFVIHEEESKIQNDEIDLDGNSSGITAGLIATKLVNKLALSASAGYLLRMNNISNNTEDFQPPHAITYTASAGYLLFPKEYTSYRQTNFNLYFEMIGQSFTDKKQSFIDVAPAVQFIFNSIARVDIGYRTQLSGNINRLSNSYFMVRLEYNLLNVLSKK